MEVSNRCAIQVGRLVELSIDSGYRDVTEVDALFEAVRATCSKAPAASKLVFVTDWRRCPLMSSEAAERALLRITQSNPRVERSAALASSRSPVAVLQFLRLVRDSQLPTRKLFFDANELVGWLKEALAPAEIERLREFLREPVPG
jgi:hypothetical protein